MSTDSFPPTILARNRLKKSPVLSLELPYLYLLDNEFISAIMQDVYDGEEKKWTCIENINIDSDVPKIHGIYMFVWRPSFLFNFEDFSLNTFYILYVGKSEGITSSIKSRFNSEYKKLFSESGDILWKYQIPSERDERLKQYFTLKPLEMWCIEIINTDSIDNLEDRLIKAFNPPANKQRKPDVQVGTPKKPFKR